MEQGQALEQHHLRFATIDALVLQWKPDEQRGLQFEKMR